ncbi:lytic murein transglycosylase [Sphingomonas aestuarii]
MRVVFGNARRAGLGLFAFALAAICPSSAAFAQDGASFESYMRTLSAEARRQGVSQRTIDAVVPTLTYNPRVVELDRAQPGGAPGSSAIPPFAPYRARHVDASRINRGRNAYQRVRPTLYRISEQTGVPTQVMVAIWGHETNYGAVRGNFDLARSLASLAYEGRRRELFAGEFIAVLKAMDRGIPRSRLVGSWAGATGHPQFLPSVYLRLAVDGDGDGVADIWSSEADALASIANYFVFSGWRSGEPWGVPVRVPGGFNRSELTTRMVSPRCPRVFERHSQWRTMAEWRALGITPQGRTLGDNVMASLIEPDGPGQTAYLLTGNYRVILDYNCSNFYALSVGLLADEIAR